MTSVEASAMPSLDHTLDLHCTVILFRNRSHPFGASDSRFAHGRLNCPMENIRRESRQSMESTSLLPSPRSLLRVAKNVSPARPRQHRHRASIATKMARKQQAAPYALCSPHIPAA
jgi:hypothetical protein